MGERNLVSMVEGEPVLFDHKNHNRLIRDVADHHASPHQEYFTLAQSIAPSTDYNLDIPLDDPGDAGYTIAQVMLRSSRTLADGYRFAIITVTDSINDATAMASSGSMPTYSGFYVMCYSKVNSDTYLTEGMWGAANVVQRLYW